MKIKFIHIFAVLSSVLLVSACDDGYEYYDGLYVSWAAGKTPIYNMLIDDQFPKTLDLTIASSEQVDRDIMIRLETDTSLITAYNKKFHTNYKPVPDGAFVLTDPIAVIRKGNFSTTDPVRFNIVSKDGFKTGENYMMPVAIAKVGEGYRVIESCRTVYVTLSEVIVRPAVDFGGNGFVGTKFSKIPEKKLTGDVRQLTKFSFEARVYIHGYREGAFNTILGLEENFMIRLSSFSGGNGRLEVAGGGIAHFVSNNQPFPLKQWVHVAVVYDGNESGAGKVSIYQNGELQIATDVQRDEPRKYIDLTRHYNVTVWEENAYCMIGESIKGRVMNGAISEARIWAKALTASEIRSHMCAVDSQSPGLIAYWHFDEKGGMNFADQTGHGYHMESLIKAPLDYVDDVRCPE